MAGVKKKKATSSNGAVTDRYINRELSWLDFNFRVLSEAFNAENPLLERLKFLAIFESNLDEFYMVRVSGLIEQYEGGFGELTPDGLSAFEQLQLIQDKAVPMRASAGELLKNTIEPALAESGIAIRKFKDLPEKQRAELESYFLREVFPVCTPLILHPSPSVPFISNRSLNLAVELSDRAGEAKLARVKIPSILPRTVKVYPRRNEFVMLEDLIANHLTYLFPGVTVKSSHLFRVIRDADVEIRELEAADLLSMVEETLRKRRFGDPVRIDIQPTMPDQVRKLLLRLLELDESDAYILDGHLGLEFLWELAFIDKANLKYPLFQPYLHEMLSSGKAIFDTIKSGDVMVYHPFDSFRSVEQFISSAAHDPNVMGIKQTLYRVGSESPVVESLLEAAEEGKQVAVMVELKARFDESNNLVWARALERAGVHMSYGFSEMKTHAKLCLVVRKEQSGMKSYAHIGTGNYNPATARIYTDLGIFTDDADICQDIAELFNFLTGFSKQSQYRCLLVAPLNLREGIIERIERETAIHKKTGAGRIVFKLNSLVDPEVIDALYDASQAGVRVELMVRGVCCLRPGVKGLSENIRVISVVGRFLEHSRAFYFENGGHPELFLGSADLMRRNLDRRIEVLAPVKEKRSILHIRDEILEICLKDNVNAWELQADATYHRLAPTKDAKRFSSHEWFMKNPPSKQFFG